MRGVILRVLMTAVTAGLLFGTAMAAGRETVPSACGTLQGELELAQRQVSAARQREARLRGALTHLKYAMQRDTKQGWPVRHSDLFWIAESKMTVMDLCPAKFYLGLGNGSSGSSMMGQAPCAYTPELNPVTGDYYKTVLSALADQPIPEEAPLGR